MKEERIIEILRVNSVKLNSFIHPVLLISEDKFQGIARQIKEEIDIPVSGVSGSLPWDGVLKDWNIVGMNHYNLNGEKHLFVAMTNGDKCIKAEGINEIEVFDKLIQYQEDLYGDKEAYDKQMSDKQMKQNEEWPKLHDNYCYADPSSPDLYSMSTWENLAHDRTRKVNDLIRRTPEEAISRTKEMLNQKD